MLSTIDRGPNVPNSPNSFAQFTRGIEKVTKVDDHTIVVRAKAPNPMLLNDFAAKKALVVTPKAQRRFNAMMVRPAGGWSASATPPGLPRGPFAARSGTPPLNRL